MPKAKEQHNVGDFVLNTYFKKMQKNSKWRPKLDILIPQYKETEKVISNLLYSIQIQEQFGYDNTEFCVYIMNDGTDVNLSSHFLNQFDYPIIYYYGAHFGVSATRQDLFNLSSSQYVMWCDADDSLYATNTMSLIMTELHGIEIRHNQDIVNNPYPDMLISDIVNVSNGVYRHTPANSIFVHGKIYNRNFLLENNLFWDSKLTIHEDSYFNCLVTSYAQTMRKFQDPLMLWRTNHNSVSRSDRCFKVRTTSDFLKSTEALISNQIARHKTSRINDNVARLYIQCYLDLNEVDFIGDKYFDGKTGTVCKKTEEMKQEDARLVKEAEQAVRESYKRNKNLYQQLVTDEIISKNLQDLMLATGMQLADGCEDYNSWLARVTAE